MDILYPFGVILAVVFLYLYLRAPAQDEARKRAAYERAHEYGPCPSISKDLELERLSKYADDAAFVRRQETIHDNCEGHAICDLVSSIEHDYRQQKEQNV